MRTFVEGCRPDASKPPDESLVFEDRADVVGEIEIGSITEVSATTWPSRALVS